MSYSAVVLDDESANMLKQRFAELMPDWKWYGHHMTIKMGGLPDNLKKLIGLSYSLIVTHLGRSDTTIALRVEDGGLSFNDTPHITLCVDVDNGGKPVDSNKITDWTRVGSRFRVSGTVEEIS